MRHLDELRWKVAIHEAGHAIILAHVGGWTRRVSLNNAGGGACDPHYLVKAQYEGGPRFWLAYQMVTVGGAAAVRSERAGLNWPGVEGDWKHFHEAIPRVKADAPALVMSWDEAVAMAEKVTGRYRKSLTAIAEALYERGSLDSGEVSRLQGWISGGALSRDNWQALFTQQLKAWRNEQVAEQHAREQEEIRAMYARFLQRHGAIEQMRRG